MPKRDQVTETMLRKRLLTYNFSTLNIITDLKGQKKLYNQHYGSCTGRLLWAATRHNATCSNSINLFTGNMQYISKPLY